MSAVYNQRHDQAKVLPRINSQRRTGREELCKSLLLDFLRYQPYADKMR